MGVATNMKKPSQMRLCVSAGQNGGYLVTRSGSS